MAYYILFHIRNQPPLETEDDFRSKGSDHGQISLTVTFARKFREEVKKASPPFGKRSELLVGDDGVALFDQLEKDMLEPSTSSLMTVLRLIPNILTMKQTP